MSWLNFNDVAERSRINQSELEDLLFRFEGRFSQSLTSANHSLANDPDPAVRNRALTNQLNYASAALEIALGPVPEANLLDMVTFIELTRNVLKNHWVPKVFGDRAQALQSTFNEASVEIWEIASLVLDASQRETLMEIITEWQSERRQQFNVEGVRLSHFAEATGSSSTTLGRKAGGLFSDVRRVTLAVDSAVLLGERALYAAQRMPSLLRLQARVGSAELLRDSIRNLSSLAALAPKEGQIGSVLADVGQTVANSEKTLREANEALETTRAIFAMLNDNPRIARPGIEFMQAATATLAELNQVVTSSQEAQALDRLNAVMGKAQEFSNRLLLKLFLLGAGLLIVAGLVVVTTRLISRQIALGAPTSKAPMTVSTPLPTEMKPGTV